MQTAFMNNTSIPFTAESSAGTIKSTAVVYPRVGPISTLPTKMEVKDLSIYYNKFRAVEDISIAFPANQITAIIGPSGCGKSTLLRSLNRMTELIPRARVEGSVLLDGEDHRGQQQCHPKVIRINGQRSFLPVRSAKAGGAAARPSPSAASRTEEWWSSPLTDASYGLRRMKSRR